MNTSNRRQFIRQLALAGTASSLAFPAILRAQNALPKLRVALIGTGGIGGAHIDGIKGLGVDCTACCDVDTGRFKKGLETWPNAKQYQDYREMLEKEAKNIDAVMIGTPDHHHYPATILAMQQGKHVYTQKPLTHTIWEARQLTLAAEKYKVATQMGNQGTANEGVRLCYEWIHSGLMGDIKEVHVWTNRPVWPQGMNRPEGEDPVPATLNWDVWLGPAPLRPHKKDVYHPFKWRGWLDFGGGALADMACHTLNAVFFALDPGYPTSVELIEVDGLTTEAFPKGAIVKWEFPKTKKRPAFTLFWYEGNKKASAPRPPELEASVKIPDSGALFIGTKEKMVVWGDYNDHPHIIPSTHEKELGGRGYLLEDGKDNIKIGGYDEKYGPKKLLERSIGHYKEWVLAATGEKPIGSPLSKFAYAGPFTETISLGNVALRLGKKLEWDGKKLQFKGDREANALVSKEYRKGWKF